MDPTHPLAKIFTSKPKITFDTVDLTKAGEYAYLAKYWNMYSKNDEDCDYTSAIITQPCDVASPRWYDFDGTNPAEYTTLFNIGYIRESGMTISTTNPASGIENLIDHAPSTDWTADTSSTDTVEITIDYPSYTATDSGLMITAKDPCGLQELTVTMSGGSVTHTFTQVIDFGTSATDVVRGIIFTNKYSSQPMNYIGYTSMVLSFVQLGDQALSLKKIQTYS